MDDYDKQTIRTVVGALEELKREVGIPHGESLIRMSSFLLAHLVGRQAVPGAAVSIDDELAALARMQAEEQSIFDLYQAAPAETDDFSAEAMTAYVRGHLGDKAEVVSVRTLIGGTSKQTIILGLHDGSTGVDAVVIRRDLPGGPVELKAADELPILQAMHAHGVPVAEPLWADHTPPFSGSCVVTRRVGGMVAYDLTATEQGGDGARNALALARTLARIHRIAVADTGLPLGDAEQSAVAAMIEDYETQWQRRRIEDSPTIAVGLAWLKANIPPIESLSVVHGDCSMRNFMVEQGEATALLDWELWHFGDHNQDLAYCRAEVEQFISWDAFVAEYLAHGGKPVRAASLPFWQVFGPLRNLIFAANIVHAHVHAPRPLATPIYSALYGGRWLLGNVAADIKRLR